MWVYVGVCGCMWVYVGVCGCMWVYVGVYVYLINIFSFFIHKFLVTIAGQQLDSRAKPATLWSVGR